MIFLSEILSEIKFIHGGRILNFNFNFIFIFIFNYIGTSMEQYWNNYETNTVLNYGDRKLKEEKKKVYG